VPELETAQQLAERFNSRAATYDEGETHRLIARDLAGFVDVTGVHDVLDAGTGTALMLRELALRVGASVRLTGVDLSPGMLEIARAELPRAEFILGDATRLPVGDASFDLVTCVTALHLIPDAGAAFREWARVVRPSGRIVVATFTSIMGWGHLVVPAHEAPTAGLVVLRSVDWKSPASEGFPDVVFVELGHAPF
jgi:ubiquinone/menaquinone biosynthesis C-methylase UbiE